MFKDHEVSNKLYDEYTDMEIQQRINDDNDFNEIDNNRLNIKYKFNEDNLISELKAYIDSTYDAHYSTSGFQSSEVIIDRGRGMGFFLGNVDKYSARYGNKGSVADYRKDLMKVLHYALLALHTHDLES